MSNREVEGKYGNTISVDTEKHSVSVDITPYDCPSVYVDLSASQARDLAKALIDAAEEADPPAKEEEKPQPTCKFAGSQRFSCNVHRFDSTDIDPSDCELGGTFR